ncbi:MAG: FHA domain-containing protein [Anaerolineae bacterium]|nr:FHA domain-containing protein [Anaerolineae bacterium]
MLILLVVLAFPAAAQDDVQPGIYTYGCTFDEASNTVQVRADLTDRDGKPMFVDSVSVTNLELPEGSVTFQRAESREPVRTIVVIDTTRSWSMPVESMRDTLQDKMSAFPVLDELALVTFNDRSSPLLGPPTIEKIAVIDQYRDRITVGGDPQAGIAALYDGILTALRDGFDPSSTLRRVVLVLTDSAQRDKNSDVTLRDVVERAQSVQAQVYVIAFDTIEDTPDFDSLLQITNATGGYLWSYGRNPGEDKSAATLLDRLSGFLDNFRDALNSEYVISVNADVLEPDPDTLKVPLDISVTTTGREISLGAFDCVVPRTNYTIAFANVSDNQFVPLDQQPLVVSTTIDPPLAEDQREIRLFLNGNTRIFGNTLSLDDPTVQGALLPSNNSLRVALLEAGDTEASPLAVAEVTGINFQRQLSLSIEGAPEAVSGPTTFVAAVNGDFAVPDNRVVRFGIRADGGEYQRLLPTSPDLIDGEAQLTIPDINARVTELFGADAANLEVIAYIDGSAPDGSDALFVSAPLPLALGEAQAAPVATAAATAEPGGTAVTPVAATSPLVIPLAAAGVLLILDLILMGQIRTARVKRLVKYPDDRELPQNMLRVTISREGRHQTYTLTKQTMSVGRGSSNDINLSDDTNISREHGVIIWRRGRWYYTHRKGQARSLIGGKFMRGFRMRELHDNTQMQIGDYTLICHYDTDADPDSLLKTQF